MVIKQGSYIEKIQGYVYITETGTVYHKSYQCTHLKLAIRQETYPMLQISGTNIKGNITHVKNARQSLHPG